MLKLKTHSTYKLSAGKCCAAFAAVLLVLALLPVKPAFAGQVTSTVNGGDWAAPSTWVGGVVPLATDTVLITSTANVNTSANLTVAGLTIDGRLSMLTSGTTLTGGHCRREWVVDHPGQYNHHCADR